jgi:hypothetical protein
MPLMMLILSSDEALIAEFKERARRTVERIERSWWREPLRAVLATGERKPIDDFVRRFKADLERRYPESERRARETKIWPR